MKGDAEIQQAVREELKWDTRLRDAEVRVEVDHGVVTLTGQVDSFAKRVAAQEAAHRVAGVLDVVNDIEVHLPPGCARADAELARVIRDALEWDTLIPAERIRTTVTEGWVTLEGDVASWHEHDAVARAVAGLAGVRGVTDRVEVRPAAVDPAEIQREIEDALERRAERAARRVEVVVDDGTVTLLGTVDSAAERRTVVGAARFTAGVRAVVDRLHVEPVA